MLIQSPAAGLWCWLASHYCRPFPKHCLSDGPFLSTRPHTYTPRLWDSFFLALWQPAVHYIHFSSQRTKVSFIFLISTSLALARGLTYIRGLSRHLFDEERNDPCTQAARTPVTHRHGWAYCVNNCTEWDLILYFLFYLLIFLGNLLSYSKQTKF